MSDSCDHPSGKHLHDHHHHRHRSRYRHHYKRRQQKRIITITLVFLKTYVFDLNMILKETLLVHMFEFKKELEIIKHQKFN